MAVWAWQQGPRAAPLWLVLAGNLSLATVALAALVLLLPHSLVARSRWLRRLRSQLLRLGKRVVHLSMQGPFYRLFVWCGRRGACGRLASRCRPPEALRVKAVGWDEAAASWAPRLPLNPFHEEDYILAWRPADPADAAWSERRFACHEDCEELAAGRLRGFFSGLPEHTALLVRACAVNAHGRSAWGEEQALETQARPSEAGGGTGPQGPAGGGCNYRWAQTANEVSLWLPVGQRRGRDIKVKVLPARLEVRCAAPEGEPDELLVGTLPRRVKADEATWQIEENEEDGRHVALQLCKAEAMEKWPCFIEADGHPRIDTRLVRFLTRGMGAGGLGGLDIFE